MRKALISSALAVTATLAMSYTHASKAQTTIVVESEWLHCNDTVLVYSPACKDKAKELPTVFLLHGWSGCYRDWSEHMDIQALADETGFRIICPDGFYDSWYVNNADPAKMQWRSFFWEEFWPLMQKRYSLLPDRTFITGLSMGGHGAMNIFLDHPERFRGAGSMSGVLDLKYSGGSKTTIPPIMGATDIEDPKCRRECAVERLGRMYEMCDNKELKQKLIVVTCGQQDTKFFLAAQEFVHKCMELNLRHIAQFSPAKHRWPYWTWAVKQHVAWFGQEYRGEGIGEGDK